MITSFPEEFIFEQKMLMERLAYTFWFEDVRDSFGDIVNRIVGYVEVEVPDEEDKALFLNYDGKQYAVISASDQNGYMLAAYDVTQTSYMDIRENLDKSRFCYERSEQKIVFDIIEADS